MKAARRHRHTVENLFLVTFVPSLNWSFVSSANPHAEGMSFPLAEFSRRSWISSLPPPANKYFIFLLLVVRKRKERKKDNQLLLFAGAVCILIPDSERTSECPSDMLHKRLSVRALLREPKIAFSKQWHTEAMVLKAPASATQSKVAPVGRSVRSQRGKIGTIPFTFPCCV